MPSVLYGLRDDHQRLKLLIKSDIIILWRRYFRLELESLRKLSVPCPVAETISIDP